MTQIREHNVCLKLSWFKDFTVYLSHNDRENAENSPLAWIFLDIASLQRSRRTGNPGFKTLRLIARTDCMFVWNFSAYTFNAAMYTDLSQIHIHLFSLQFHQQANNDDGYTKPHVVWSCEINSFTGKILSIWKLSLVDRIFVHVPGFGIQ